MAPLSRILVVNSGSSSLKLRVVDDRDELVGSADPRGSAGGSTAAALAAEIAGLGPVDAVGHRVVHGGTELAEAVRVDGSIVEQLEGLTELAPLHQPGALAALRGALEILPDVPHVACFDTAFHARLPAAAATYALPGEWRERWPIRRFGFHGLSHAYVARRASQVLGRPLEDLRLVTCHLGAGASLAAVQGGRSVDTTMGFTPLEGLVMATRSGSVDPGLLLWLQDEGRLSADDLAEGLERRSGLAGLAGTADMREVVAKAAAGSAEARLAIDVYVHRLRAGIAAMAASMNGLDAVVFTGGVGEHAPGIRSAALGGLAFLGLTVDPPRNERSRGDREVGQADARGPRALVIESREDLEIARQVRALLERAEEGASGRAVR